MRLCRTIYYVPTNMFVKKLHMQMLLFRLCNRRHLLPPRRHLPPPHRHLRLLCHQRLYHMHLGHRRFHREMFSQTTQVHLFLIGQ